MKISEITYADTIPELNITDTSFAQHLGQIDNRDVWLISDHNYFIPFFKDGYDKIAAYIAFTIAEHDGFVDLARIHNKSNTAGLITALLQFARSKGFKFCIPNTEPLTTDGFNWLAKLIAAGGRGFNITDQNHKQVDINSLKQERETARKTGSPGKTSIFIEGRIDTDIGQSLLEKYPSALLKPTIRFIGDTTLD